MQCPKCGYQRQEHDAHVMAGVCPACGIAYNKWRERLAAGQTGPAAAENSPDTVAAGPPNGTPGEEGGSPGGEVARAPLPRLLLNHLLFVPSDRHESAFWGHAVLYAGFLAWGWSFMLGGIDWLAINSSFLHNVNLAFHEFGHVAFSPFGRFMAILGGSLFQVLLPLGLLAVFSVRRRDNFAASVMLWWCGQNFIDIAPYIADARDRVMPLIGGLGQESHDWGNLLRMTGTLDHAGAFARASFLAGAALILLSNLWGAALLYIELRGRRVLGDEPI